MNGPKLEGVEAVATVRLGTDEIVYPCLHLTETQLLVGAFCVDKREEYALFWGALGSSATLARTSVPQAFVRPNLGSDVKPVGVVNGWMVAVATFRASHPSVDDDSALALFHVESGTWQLWRKSRWGRWAVSPGGNFLAWQTDDAVEVLDLRTRALVATIGWPAESRGTSVAINDAGTHVVVGGGAAEIQCRALDGRVVGHWPGVRAHQLILAEDDPAVFSIYKGQISQHQWQGPTVEVSRPSHNCVAFDARARRAFFVDRHDFSFVEIDLTNDQECSRGVLPAFENITVDFENRRVAVIHPPTGGAVKLFSIT